EVRLQLTVRSTRDAVRKHLLDGIKRIAFAAAQGARAPEPVVTVDPEEFTPALVNDSKLARKTVEVFRQILGEENVYERPLILGGEDFSRYGREGVPIFLYFIGTVSPERIEQARRESRTLPSLHSEFFYPTPGPTIQTGVRTMSMAVLNLLVNR